jgi:hypothetical protein
LRNKDAIEYVGTWEILYNPNFNYGEFTIIKNEAGSRAYRISVKDWVGRTNAIGIMAKSGRYGGTYAYNLGKQYYNAKDYLEALKYYRKSAEQGNTIAKEQLKKLLNEDE